MNWITKAEAQEAAKQGVIPALKCSLKHHQQGRDAEKFELIEAIENKKFSCSYGHCACCAISGVTLGNTSECVKCPLGAGFCGYNSVWGEVAATVAVFTGDYSNANLEAFQKAESDVCGYIENVLNKEIAKEKATSEIAKCEELRHGDYGYHEISSQPYLYIKNSEGVICLVGKTETYPKHRYNPTCHSILGNIFDDLKRNSEDLKAFRMCVGATDMWIGGTEQGIWFHNGLSSQSGAEVPIEEMVEFHQKLGRVIATKRKLKCTKQKAN